MKTSLLSFLCLFFAIQLLAQPYDSLLFVGSQSAPQFTDDSLYFNYCQTTIPYSNLKDTLYNRDEWRILPGQQIDDLFPQVSPNELIPRSVGRSGVAYATPGLRHWLVSSGLHTWDSLNRRVTTYPLAWRASEQRGFGFDASGYYGYQNHLLLPRRDSLGKFYHLVFDFSFQAPIFRTYARQSFDQLLLYHVDATEDRSIPEATTGRSGNGRHLRYRPAPDDTLARYEAIVWTGGANAYDTIKANRQPLATLSHMVGIPHGNGRDWWVFATGGQQSSRSVAIFLLDANGLQLKHHYPDGIPFYRAYQHFFFSSSQVSVSPDGSQIAMHSTPYQDFFATYPDIVSGEPFAWDDTGIALWDFDRCSGEITQTRKLAINYQPSGLLDRYFDDLPPTAIRPGNGVTFGPNNRYLFYSEYSYVARLDLMSNDIVGSQEILPVPTTNNYNCYGPGQPSVFVSFNYITALANGTLLGSPGGGCRIQSAYFNIGAENIAEVYGGFNTLQSPCINSVQYVRQSINTYDLPSSSCDTLGINGWQPGCSAFRPMPDTAFICSGLNADTLVWRGLTITTGGEYAYKVQDPRGCDSLWRLVVREDENVGPLAVRISASAGDTIGSVIVVRDTSFTEIFARALSGCDSVVTYQVTIRSSSTRDLRVLGSLQVYPNPVSAGNSLKVVLPKGHGVGYQLSLVDLLGRQWWQGAAVSGDVADIDISSLPSGMYVVRYIEGNGIWQAQVVVE